MSDPPTIQPLVSASTPSSTSPPKADLPSMRQRSLEQAQEELSNRTQSPTGGTDGRFDLVKGRRNAVDANSSQSTSPPDHPPKPSNPTMSTPVVTGSGSGPTSVPPKAAATSAATGPSGQSRLRGFVRPAWP